MKKFFTSALVATMVAGSAITAFAEVDSETIDFGSTLKVGETEYTMGSDLSTVKVSGGDKIFMPVMFDSNEDGTADANITKSSDLEDVRLYVKVTEGKEYVSSYEFAKVDDVYGVEIELNDYFGDDSEEISAEIEIKSRRTGRTIASTDDLENMPSFELENEVMEVPSDSKGVAEFEVTEDTQIVEFDGDTDFISFSGDGFYYDVKASDQDPLYLGVSYSPVKEISVAYQNADLDFISFPGAPEFDFSGNFSVLVPDPDEEYYLYEVKASGKLAETNAQYDEEDEAFVLRTRSLTSYILSDQELDLEKYNEGIEGDETDKETDETDKEEETDGEKENADTGAADMIGVASALAVVSVAVAGAATMKKNRK